MKIIQNSIQNRQKAQKAQKVKKKLVFQKSKWKMETCINPYQKKQEEMRLINASRPLAQGLKK